MSQKDKLITIYVPQKLYGDYRDKLWNAENILRISRASDFGRLKDTDIGYLTKIGCNLLRIVRNGSFDEEFFLINFDYQKIPKMTSLSEDGQVFDSGLVVNDKQIIIYDDYLE